MAPPGEKGRYTFADCLTWDENDHAELIGGKIDMMAPPSRVHQKISGELFRQLANFLEGKNVKCMLPPSQCAFLKKARTRPRTWIQWWNRIFPLCATTTSWTATAARVRRTWWWKSGAPSTQRHDRLIKLNLYQRAGVREYWILNPEERTAQVFLLQNGQLLPWEVYGTQDVGKVNVLDGCFVELSKVFAE